MPTYIGFSTQDVGQPRNLVQQGADGGIGTITQQPPVGKKYRLVDTELVIQDLLNAFSIKQGDKVGQPSYGTTLWNFVFEPNTEDVRDQIQAEVRRVASLDPRLTLGTIQLYTHDNGVLIEMQMSVSPFNNVVPFGFFLNKYDGSIQRLSQ